MLLYRNFTTASVQLKKAVLSKLKGRSTSSQEWLARQLSDPYVEKAKRLSYRCRSAFKLLEINERFHILKPGYTIIDCGAAPGSWTQVAVKKVNSFSENNTEPVGKVIAIDRLHFYPIDGAVILTNSDFMLTESQAKVRDILGNNKADVVMSDMAPNATGIKDMDNENMLTLCYMVLRFAVQVSKVDAALLIKLWQCGETKHLENDINKFYNSVKIVKPNASRSDSAEIFLLARNFKGLKTS